MSEYSAVEQSFPVIGDDGCPSSFTLSELHIKWHARLVNKIVWAHNIDADEADDRLSQAWLLLLERLQREPTYFAYRSLGFIFAWLVSRSRVYKACKHASHQRTSEDEAIERRHYANARNYGHARHAHQVEFYIDFTEAVQHVAELHHNNDAYMWMLYLVLTGRRQECLHERRPKQGLYTKWDSTTMEAAQQVTGLSDARLRQVRRQVQSDLARAITQGVK